MKNSFVLFAVLLAVACINYSTASPSFNKIAKILNAMAKAQALEDKIMEMQDDRTAIMQQEPTGLGYL